MKVTTLSAPRNLKELLPESLPAWIEPDELSHQLHKGRRSIIVDVRAPQDFIKGHVPTAVNLPEGLWNQTQHWLNDRPMIVYCYSETCRLATQAAEEFIRQGHAVMEMIGGFEAWKDNRLPQER